MTATATSSSSSLGSMSSAATQQPHMPPPKGNRKEKGEGEHPPILGAMHGVGLLRFFRRVLV